MLREVIRACEAGTLTPPPLSLPEEAVYLQAYNTRLVNKLTDKLLELERANLQLTSMYDRLQAVSQQLIDAQETERQSIARELHDEIGQALTAATLSLYLAQEVCGAAALPYLTDVNDIMARLLQQVRNMALDLRPVMLDDLGLSAAMQWYVDRQEQRSGLAIHLHLPSAAVRLPADLETACFRITQEALTNIMRHAQARQVWLDVQHDAEAVHLTIRDDGRGFDANAVRQRSTQDAHFGLLSMRERVELLGGQFTLSSEPGRGTTIQISIPLHTRVPAQRPRSAQP
jgi:signal transduction histidine kinase